ncbi:MAG TPA: DUF4954 family protein [Planctomycetes bacterium]|nr:DUF4954 family protein [Planctomycetota bacterium]
MIEGKSYRALTQDEIKALEANSCSAQDWNLVRVAEGFDTKRVKNAHFSGPVFIGCLKKKVSLFGGVQKNTGIYNATIHNCRIGNDVYISNVEDYIANYNIEDDVIINHVALLAVDGESAFGNGTEVSVVNEGGGREIPIYDHLSSHVAYIIAMYRHRKTVIVKLKDLIAQYVASVTSATGLVGQGAKITDCGTLRNINVGKAAVLDGASRLENGSINSLPEDPTFVGTNVIADDFILASGAKVRDNSILSHCFVGQATELARQYSAEHSVFFANCGGYHGEACAVFAGPYTVTHHKSTLLIAGLFSFLNAGSGSNQSNHMYKLGPVHQGIVERGSKTTSDSYMLWPAKVGAFTMVMGRHYANSDTSDLPFSYIIEHEDESVLIPGVNLRSVGTVRDARKWPNRDKRKGPKKLDLISFNLLTPYTVQKIINGLKVLRQLKESSGQTSQNFYYNGVKIKRSSLENGMIFYKIAIDRYLGNILVRRLRENEFSTIDDLRAILAVNTQIGKGTWVDLAGLVAPQETIEKLLTQIENKNLSSLEDVNAKLKEIYDDFETCEWAWVANVLEQKLDISISRFGPGDVAQIIENWIESVEKLDLMRCGDAGKEFSLMSRIGFGIDGAEPERDADFEAVRGTAEENSFTTELKDRLQKKKQSAAKLIDKLRKIG